MEILEQIQEFLAQGYVLHGSQYKLEYVEPRQAQDFSDRPEANQRAVYATRDLRMGLIMATLRLPDSGTGVIRIWHADLDFISIEGHNLDVRAGFIHALPPDTFTLSHQGRQEFISRVPVKSVDVLAVEPSILKHLQNIQIKLSGSR